MQRMMKKMSGKGGMRKMMGQMKNMLPRIRWWRSRSVLIFLLVRQKGSPW
jgi:signal recognition particle GTPase